MKNIFTYYFKILFLHSLLFLGLVLINPLSAQEPDWLEPVLNPFGLSAPMGEDTLCRVIMVDIDHDDTLESFIQIIENIPPFNWQDLKYYKNTQTDEDPFFEFLESYPFEIPDNSPNWLWQFADVTCDGQEDFVSRAFIFNNPVSIIENGGPPNPDFSGGFLQNPFGITLPEASNGDIWDGVTPTFVDIDDDGKLDLFYGGLYNNSSEEAFYFSRNIGTPTEPQYSAPEVNPFGLNYPSGVGGYHVESFADVDCDGDLDLYFLGTGGGQSFRYFFENIGTSTSPDFSSQYTFAKAYGVRGSFIDIGGDGDLDLITFKTEGGQGVWFYENPTYPEVVDFDTTSNGSTYTFINNSSDRPLRYHWDFEDGETSDQENPVHTYTQSGMFEVCLTAGGGIYCQNTTCKTIDVVVSTKELYLDAKINLYPNPAYEFLTFELESEENLDQVKVDIFNITSQRITSHSVQSFNNTLQKTISLEEFPSGLYLLKVNSKNKFLTHKFLKF